jgi:hypothetical protein
MSGVRFFDLETKILFINPTFGNFLIIGIWNLKFGILSQIIRF